MIVRSEEEGQSAVILMLMSSTATTDMSTVVMLLLFLLKDIDPYSETNPEETGVPLYVAMTVNSPVEETGTS